jgi:hypothetical protein
MEKSLIEKRNTRRWYERQRAWHARRPGAWHAQQARWYRAQLRQLFSLSDLIALAFEAHTSDLVANVTCNNVLLARLKA